jgi:peptide/nickel transport system permease protein
VYGHVLRRLISVIPVVLIVSVVSFSLVELTGADPAVAMLGESADPQTLARVRSEMALDRPIYERYWRWLSGALTGDLGRSILPTRYPVMQLIGQRAPVTLELGLLALALAVVCGLPLGIIAGVRPGSWTDRIVSQAAFVGVAVPNFLVGLMLILVFAVWLRWVPPSGYVAATQDLGANFRQMLLPAITMAAFLNAFMVRITRASIAEVMRRDFIRTARGKGLTPRSVVVRHALKAALIPVITITGLQLGAVLGGSIVVETIFSLPGLGRLTVESIYARDFPVLQGTVLMLSIAFVLTNTLVDIAYGYLDPRIRYG